MISAELPCNASAFTQNATEKVCRLNQLPRSTSPSTPLSEKACPTLPRWKDTPPLTVPSWVPAASVASPCPRHQLTRLGGGATQGGGGFTVRVALELKTV